MGGIFGYADPQRRIDGSVFVARQAQLLTHSIWAQTDWHADPAEPIGLGRIGPGIFNARPQPVWSDGRRRAIVLAGEVYAIDGRPLPPDSPHPEQLLDLYAHHGPGFARAVDGAFVCAIWDADNQTLVLTNDRFGLYPVYYSLQDGRLIFASEVKAVIAAPGFRRRLDLVAVAENTRFQHLLGDRMFFEDVSQLAPASLLAFDLRNAHGRVSEWRAGLATAARPGPWWTGALIHLRPAELPRRVSGRPNRAPGRQHTPLV